VTTVIGNRKDEIAAYLDRTQGKLSDEATLREEFLYYNSLQIDVSLIFIHAKVVFSKRYF
jgi:hypothetical protein